MMNPIGATQDANETHGTGPSSQDLLIILSGLKRHSLQVIVEANYGRVCLASEVIITQ